jgi:integrase
MKKSKNKTKNKHNQKLKGLWTKGGWWYFKTTISGKRKNFSLRTMNYQEAISKALRIIDSQPLNYSNSLESGINEFIECKLRKGLYTKQSAISKKGILLDFCKSIGTNPPLGTLSPNHIRSFFDYKRNLATSTKNGYQIAIQSFLSWCVNEQHLLLDECRKEIKSYKFKSTARKHYLSADELQLLLNSCDDDELLYVILCGGILGMRKNEIIHSRKCWFEFNSGVPVCFIQNLEPSNAQKMGLDSFRIKNGRERRVPINSSALEWLKSYVSTKDQYCLAPDSRTGKSRYRYDFRKKFDSLVNRVFPSKSVGTHTLRHSFATNLAINNSAIGFIAQYLGDSVKTTEKHYAQFLPTRESVDVVKFQIAPIEKKVAA